MQNNFSVIEPERINDNFFKLIGGDWMLITAGSSRKFNTMTASWGGFGVLWFKNISICFVRPQRYTCKFIEESEYYTLSFFDAKYKSALEFCGSKSGRNVDKIKETGLTPIETDFGAVTYSEARLVILSKKLYSQSFNPDNFTDVSILKEIYPSNDFHKIFIGEIIKAYIRR